MMAFTLVGLMLSLFGGIFAALSAFRTFTEGDIRERASRQCLDLEALQQRKDENGMEDAITLAKKHTGSMKVCRRLWNFAQVLPIVVFLSFALFMASWAVLNWEVLTVPQSWIGWKVILIGGISADLISLLAVAVGWVGVRIYSNRLDEHVRTVNGFLAKVVPDALPTSGRATTWKGP